MAQAKIRNARKSFNWKVILAGIDQFSIQTVKLPIKEIEKVEHGDTNHNVSSPGKISWSDMEFDKLLNYTGSDNDVWDWMKNAQDAIDGGGTPSQFERIITLVELAPDQVTTLNTHIVTLWPMKVEYGKHSRVDSAENIIEKVTFAVNGYERT
jgi:hypothetical protein